MTPLTHPPAMEDEIDVEELDSAAILSDRIVSHFSKARRRQRRQRWMLAVAVFVTLTTVTGLGYGSWHVLWMDKSPLQGELSDQVRSWITQGSLFN